MINCYWSVKQIVIIETDSACAVVGSTWVWQAD